MKASPGFLHIMSCVVQAHITAVFCDLVTLMPQSPSMTVCCSHSFFLCSHPLAWKPAGLISGKDSELLVFFFQSSFLVHGLMLICLICLYNYRCITDFLFLKKIYVWKFRKLVFSYLFLVVKSCFIHYYALVLKIGKLGFYTLKEHYLRSLTTYFSVMCCLWKILKVSFVLSWENKCIWYKTISNVTGI